MPKSSTLQSSTRLLAISLVIYTAALATLTAFAQTDSKLQIPETDDGLPGAGPINRTESFKKLWLERRSKWATRKQQDEGSLVFLGDSITQGWGDDISGAFPGVKVANRGISGDTSRGVLIRLKDDVIALKPAGVILLIGTNDLAHKAEPETIAGNVKRILDELKKHDSKMPIILCQVMPSSTTKTRPADKIKEINKLYAEAVKGDPQVTFIETYTLFANKEGDAKPEEFPDLLHPNKAGYTKWAAAIRPILATLGFVETEPDNFKLEPGYESLFNGRDLTGWGFRDQKTLEKKESFDGKTASSDDRYVAKNGRLIVTTPSEGRKIAQIWTTREFPKNFTLKLEFRATPNADSGVFIRKPQLQCRDYVVAGPPQYSKPGYKPQDWNELVVVVKDGAARCTCNGEVLEDAWGGPPGAKLPETGPIGLEGDRGQMEYRRIRIQEQ